MMPDSMLETISQVNRVTTVASRLLVGGFVDLGAWWPGHLAKVLDDLRRRLLYPLKSLAV